MDLKGAIAYPLCGNDGHPLDGKGLARGMTIISPAQRAGVAGMGEGICRRVFISSLEFAKGRSVFGKLLTQQPMMQDTLLTLMAESEAAHVLLLKVGSLLSKEDYPNKTPNAFELQRILVPMAKFRCCRRGVDLTSMAIEIFGGNGYIEDWGMERQYRDAQNHPMWEGTEIVLSMDVLRAAPTCLKFLLDLFQSVSQALCSSKLHSCQILGKILSDEISFCSQIDVTQALPGGNLFANLLADISQFGLLCEQGLFASSKLNQYRSFVVAAIFANKHFTSRQSLWSRARTGGYPVTRNAFDDLVSGAAMSADQADRVIIELLAGDHKL